MATNKYPKGKGYTPNRPYSRSTEEAKKLGLNRNNAQKGTSMGVKINQGLSYDEFYKEANKGSFARDNIMQGPDKLRPKVRGSSTPIGRPTVAKPKKK